MWSNQAATVDRFYHFFSRPLFTPDSYRCYYLLQGGGGGGGGKTCSVRLWSAVKLLDYHPVMGSFTTQLWSRNMCLGLGLQRNVLFLTVRSLHFVGHRGPFDGLLVKLAIVVVHLFT